MSAQTDKAFDLIPTLKVALVGLDDALDNFDESDTTHPAHAFAKGDVEKAQDDVRIILAQIEASIA